MVADITGEVDRRIRERRTSEERHLRRLAEALEAAGFGVKLGLRGRWTAVVARPGESGSITVRVDLDRQPGRFRWSRCLPPLGDVDDLPRTIDAIGSILGAGHMDL